MAASTARTFRLPSDLADRLTAHTERMGETKTAAVTRALEALVAGEVVPDEAPPRRDVVVRVDPELLAGATEAAKTAGFTTLNGALVTALEGALQGSAQ